jgi:hypothetical protein
MVPIARIDHPSRRVATNNAVVIDDPTPTNTGIDNFQSTVVETLQRVDDRQLTFVFGHHRVLQSSLLLLGSDQFGELSGTIDVLTGRLTGGS